MTRPRLKHLAILATAGALAVRLVDVDLALGAPRHAQKGGDGDCVEASAGANAGGGARHGGRIVSAAP